MTRFDGKQFEILTNEMKKITEASPAACLPAQGENDEQVAEWVLAHYDTVNKFLRMQEMADENGCDIGAPFLSVALRLQRFHKTRGEQWTERKRQREEEERKRQEEERHRQEEEARKQQEYEERKRQEEMRKRQEEEAKRKQEEEKRKQEEEQRKKEQEQRRKREEENDRREKKNKRKNSNEDDGAAERQEVNNPPCNSCKSTGSKCTGLLNHACDPCSVKKKTCSLSSFTGRGASKKNKLLSYTPAGATTSSGGQNDAEIRSPVAPIKKRRIQDRKQFPRTTGDEEATFSINMEEASIILTSYSQTLADLAALTERVKAEKQRVEGFLLKGKAVQAAGSLDV